MRVNSGAIGAVVHVIDEMFTTDEERANAKIKLMELAHRADMGQLDVNSAEATNPTVFVSGWRPAVGWMCVSAMGWHFIGMPVIEAVAVYYGAFTGEYMDLTALPELEWSELAPVLMGMLGLGAMRTYEKTQGVARV